MIEKAVEVDADSSQFPSNWIFHAREAKPGKAFVDGLKSQLSHSKLFFKTAVDNPHNNGLKCPESEL